MYFGVTRTSLNHAAFILRAVKRITLNTMHVRYAASYSNQAIIFSLNLDMWVSCVDIEHDIAIREELNNQLGTYIYRRK